MSDTEYWQLKPKVVVDERQDYTIIRASLGSSFIQEIPNAVFDKLFEPVDIETKRQQLQ